MFFLLRFRQRFKDSISSSRLGCFGRFAYNRRRNLESISNFLSANAGSKIQQ
jgi:hypothetical protein